MSGRGNSVAKSLKAGECYSNCVCVCLCVCVCVCRVAVEEAEEVEGVRSRNPPMLKGVWTLSHGYGSH